MNEMIFQADVYVQNSGITFVEQQKLRDIMKIKNEKMSDFSMDSWVLVLSCRSNIFKRPPHLKIFLDPPLTIPVLMFKIRNGFFTILISACKYYGETLKSSIPLSVQSARVW